MLTRLDQMAEILELIMQISLKLPEEDREDFRGEAWRTYFDWMDMYPDLAIDILQPEGDGLDEIFFNGNGESDDEEGDEEDDE